PRSRPSAGASARSRSEMPPSPAGARCRLATSSMRRACGWAGGPAESLRDSTRRSLEIAKDKALRSIAFPAVGTGIAHFPMDECARIMLEEVAAHSRNPSSIREVRFVLLGADAEAAFRAEAERQLAP